MSRPLKNGLDYFSMDIDINDDPKIELIEAKHGLIGFAIYIKLLIKIYHAGYFLLWTEREQLVLSNRINVDNNSLSTIVIDYINEGLFHKPIYDEFSILTSNRIQKQYLTAMSRRKSIIMHKEFCLLDQEDDLLKLKNLTFRTYKRVIVDNNTDSMGVNVNNNPDSIELLSTKSTQRKEKERKGKEKESKENILSCKNNGIPYEEIINKLNELTDSRYDYKTEKTQSLIRTLWTKKNYRLEDFFYVIEVKVREWLGKKQEKYLRPKTLFQVDNFESYRNQKPTIKHIGALNYLRKKGAI